MEILEEPVGPGSSLGFRDLMEEQGPEARELWMRDGSTSWVLGVNKPEVDRSPGWGSIVLLEVSRLAEPG